ncbi:MAG: hypothetical protein FD143_576 [Ignavibacteria bacterium]|nr:MAG: hypothetical protein FD143_576 [Ignavibacteria bacterium]KAF0161647.1 MAG: hypothetical protein FD188_764 [Ignavibacteria bacterium]
MYGKLTNAAKLIEWEAFLWSAGLLYLFFINPYETSHSTLCLYKNLGIEFCPGCGLGRSISFLFNVDFLRSIKTHPLGIIAFVLIITRIIHLVRKKYFNKKQNEVMYG